MREYSFSARVKWLFVSLFMSMALVLPNAGQSFAATPGDIGPVLVLPFQISADDETAEQLYDELPSLVSQRLSAKGLKVLSRSEAEEVVIRAGVKTLDLRTARLLARDAGAVAAVYGTYNKLGNAFSIDARLVPADPEEPSRPIFVEQSASVNLLLAVEELSSRVANELLKATTINRVEVRGARVLDPDVILLRINTKQGDFVDVQALDRELRRIWDLGFFSDIVMELDETPEGLVLIYNITEKPRVERVNIQGADEIDREDIIAAMTTRPGSILNDKVLASDLQKIQELYRQKGYYLASISHNMEMKDNGTEAVLNLDIHEGNKLYIKEVRIEGAEQIRPGKIEDQLALTARHMFSWLTGSGVLREELVERDVSAIRTYYLNNGYMDVAVGDPRIDYEEDGIIITHRINEGPRYKVGKVRLSGELLDSDDEMLKIIKMDNMSNDREFFQLSALQDDIKFLTDYYAEYGYAYADINAQPEKDESAEEATMDINYIISKQNKVYVRNVILEGNMHTRDNVVLREMYIVDGDRFDGKKLAMSMRRLNNTGYFDMAESELVPTDNPEEVDLKIKLQERSTGAIMGGVGYNTYSSFGVSASIQENNLWGKGYSLALQGMLSGRRTAYDITFTNPRVWDTPFSTSVSLYNWRDEYWDYTRRTLGGQLQVGYPIGNYTRAYLGYRLDFYKLYDFDSGVSPLLTQYEGDRIGSMASLQLVRDTTDRMKPRDGTITRLIAQYSGGVIGGDDDFVKLIGEFQWYQGVTENTVFHFRIRGATLLENGNDDIPVYERFWMGGIDTVRGYRSKDIVPRDSTYGDRLGGNNMAFVNLEYIWNFSQDMGLNLVPFFDAGVNINTDDDYNFSDEIKKSVGLELRWRSPMGDLRFSYGYPLDDGYDGKKLKGRFEFSMGQFF